MPPSWPEQLREETHLYSLILCLILAGDPAPAVKKEAARPMQLGVDADNWLGQVRNPAFENGLKSMEIDFISWHIQPEEEDDPEKLGAIVEFCRRNHWHYLFNNEVGNYRRGDKGSSMPTAPIDTTSRSERSLHSKMTRCSWAWSTTKAI